MIAIEKRRSRLSTNMGIAERFYRSPFGRIMSVAAHLVAALHKPFMVYGFRDPATGTFRKWTRTSSNLVILNAPNLAISDHVWVWHHSILDATEGISIEEGVQLGAWVGVFTHGSETAIRLLGRGFVHIPNAAREGYSRGSVRIGAYTFVGAGALVLPGVSIGKGCLISAGAVVSQNLPDYSVAVGSPAKVKGSTLDLDRRFLRTRDFRNTYYDMDALAEIERRLAQRQSTPRSSQ